LKHEPKPIRVSAETPTEHNKRQQTKSRISNLQTQSVSNQFHIHSTIIGSC
jgi:hypothetical protein